MKPTVGMHVTKRIGSDSYPYEIIEVVNARQFIARKLDAVNTETWPVQNWVYNSNENNPTVVVTKKQYGWGEKGCKHTKFELGYAAQHLDTSL